MRQLKITKSITNRESASLDKYLQEIGREELVSPEEEVELSQRIRKGDQAALEKLTRANLRLALVSFSRASWSPLRILWESSTSSSGDTSSSRPISWRYLSKDALSRLVMDFVSFNCLMLYAIVISNNHPGRAGTPPG